MFIVAYIDIAYTYTVSRVTYTDEYRDSISVLSYQYHEFIL